MAKQQSLNLDLAGKVSELEAILNRFSLKWVTYHMLFRGKGVEFEGYREYSPDDDASLIDWMATARSQKTLVKKYIEERDLRVMFLIDVHDGMIFGSAEKLKCEYAAEVVASIAHLIISSGDKIGFCLLKKDNLEILYPQGGMRRFNILAESISSPLNYGGIPKKTDEVLGYFLDRLDNSINAVFLVSDFLNLGENFSKNFQIFSKKFETIPLMIRDKLDESLPDIDSEITIQDPSNPLNQIIINTSLARKEYEKNTKKEKEKLIGIFEENGVEHLEIKTGKNFIGDLVEFLKSRTKTKKNTPIRR